MTRLRGRRSAVTIANEVVSIIVACNLIGMDLPEDIGLRRSTKLYCPFGPLYHSDQGIDRAFRIYIDTNSAWCFAGCGYFTPVRLVAHAWDLALKTAAVELLDRVGYRPLTLAEAWSKASQREDPPDTTNLREALQTYCRRICPSWETVQFTPAVASALSKCLDLLDRVHTEEDAQEWLEGTKALMRRVLSLPG